MADPDLIKKALACRDQCKQHTHRVFGGFGPGGDFKECSYTGGQWGASNCYAGFSRNNGVISVLFSAWHSGVRKTDIGGYDTPETGAFLKWLFTESPWGRLIGAAPWYDHISPKGFILGDLETIPGVLTYGFLIASRTPFEYPSACRGWYWLVCAGVCPSLAYQAVCGSYCPNGTKIDSSHGPNYGCDAQDESYLMNFVSSRANPGNVGAKGIIARGVNQLWTNPARDAHKGSGIPLASLWTELYPAESTIMVQTYDAWSQKYVDKPQTIISAAMLLKEQVRLGLV